MIIHNHLMGKNWIIFIVFLLLGCTIESPMPEGQDAGPRLSAEEHDESSSVNSGGGEGH